MEIQALHNLLQQVSTINKKYEEIARITGERYNIFSVLKLEADEVRLHSRFIGDLLNPQSTHGQGSKFLSLFLDMLEEKLELKGYSKDAVDGAKVIIEECIGNISDNYTEGGRIDIVIKPSTGKEIVIENKIYARDQYQQLYRYNQQYHNAEVLYLTLEGKDPDIISIKCESNGDILKKDKHFKCISYREHIIEWLERCKKEAVNYPLLRETISQYINTIQTLTGQSINKKMEKEIISEIAKSSESVKAAFEVSKTIDNLKVTLLEILKHQLTELGKMTGLETEDEHWGSGDESYFYFYLPDPKHRTAICLGFGKNYDECSIGVYIDKEDSYYQNNLEYRVLKSKVSAKLSSFGNDVGGNNWLYLHCFTDDLANWNNNEIWIDIPNGKIATRIIKLVREIQESLKGIEL